MERRALDVERQVEIAIGRSDEADDAIRPVLQLAIPSDDGGSRKALFQRVNEAAVIVGERGHADAALRRRDQRPAERRLYRHVADRLPSTAAPPRSGRHTEPSRRRLVGARARPKAGGIDRLSDPLAGIELLGEAAEPMGPRIVARRRAGDLLENPMKMKGADPRGIGEFGEARDGVAVPQ